MIDYEKAAVSDIPAIAELYQNAFPEALLAVFGNPRLPPAAVADLIDGLYRHEPSGFVVARVGTRLAGFSIVSSNRGHLGKALLLRGMLATWILKWLTGHYRGIGLRFVPRLARLGWDYWRAEKVPGNENAESAQILSLVVAPHFQRRGIGRRLTELALEYLRKTPARSVRLEVDAAKEGPVRLYRKMGFQEIARLPTPRGPALVMTLHLIQ